jgi:threonyl-tRNA synthetase
VDGQYGIKPMNCLAHMLIYKSKLRSYRDLPLRYFELGTVHRHEKSGVLHGMLRARAFTQDDAHIICTPEQLIDEIVGVMEFVDYTMKVFGFPYSMELSTRPEKSIGSDEDWAHHRGPHVCPRAGTEYAVNGRRGVLRPNRLQAEGCDRQAVAVRDHQCDCTLPEPSTSFIDSNSEKRR